MVLKEAQAVISVYWLTCDKIRNVPRKYGASIQSNPSHEVQEISGLVGWLNGIMGNEPIPVTFIAPKINNSFKLLDFFASL